MDGWNTIVSFWDGLFSGELLVLGSVSYVSFCIYMISKINTYRKDIRVLFIRISPTWWQFQDPTSNAAMEAFHVLPIFWMPKVLLLSVLVCLCVCACVLHENATPKKNQRGQHPQHSHSILLSINSRKKQ